MRPTIPIIVIAALGLGGCVATDVGNPDDGEFGATVDFVAYDDAEESASPMVTGLTLESGVEIERVVFGFDRFKLRSASTCEDDSEVDLEMFVVSELLEGSDYPELPRIVRDVRQFCRFELQLKEINARDLPEGAPDVIVDRSVYVEGRLADDTPFTVELSEDEDLQLEPTTGGFFELPPEETRLFLAFEMNSWFRGLDFETVGEDDDDDERLEDGVLVIDAEFDGAFVKQFSENVSESARLFRDLDGDGELGAAERESSLAVGSSQ